MADAPESFKKPKRSRGRQYASTMLVVLGVVANTAAVADLFTKHISAIGLVGGTMAIIVGLYLLLRVWGKPVGWQVMLSVAIIVAGSVTLSLILQKGGYIDTGNTANTKPKPVDPKAITDKGKLYTFNLNDGLDLDDGNETMLVQQSYAKAPADIYFGDWAEIQPTTEKFYLYQPPRNQTGNQAKDEYNSCRNLVDNSELGKPYIADTSVGMDKSYCAQTNKGVLLLVTVEEIIDHGYKSADSSASVYVKLLKP
jgi:hypothetical protein